MLPVQTKSMVFIYSLTESCSSRIPRTWAHFHNYITNGHGLSLNFAGLLYHFLNMSATLLQPKRARILYPSPWLSLRQLRLEQAVIAVFAPVKDVYPIGADVEEDEEVVA